MSALKVSRIPLSERETTSKCLTETLTGSQDEMKAGSHKRQMRFYLYLVLG